MALTPEVLKQQEVLKSLTPEQLTAITTLSTTDEATVIKAKMGEVLGGIDSAILELTGKPHKPHGMKTVDFVKTELTTLKSSDKSKGLSEQIETLKTEKADLEKKIKEGKGDEALKGKITELEQSIKDKETSITQLSDKLKTEKETYQSDLLDLKWGNLMANAKNGLTYKSEDIISKSLRDSHLANVENAIKKDYVLDTVNEGGTKKTVFRDRDGILVTNPDDPTKPATLADILKPKVSDLLETGRKQSGGGTGGGNGGGATGSGITIKDAKTKRELTAAIQKELATQGIAANSEKYKEEFQKAYSENVTADMPLR